MSTPGGLVDKQELIDAQLDTVHLGKVVNSKDASGNPISTSTNRTGGVNKTLDALETEYTEAIRNAGGVSLGTWTAGVTTFTAYNEYAVFNGIPYKPRTTTTFPYVAQGADPTVAPDDANVQPYTDVTQESVAGLTNLQSASVADMIAKSTISGTVEQIDNQRWNVSRTNWKVSSLSKGISVALQDGKYANNIYSVFVEEFGFVDDFNPATMTGTDNTQAIRGAIAALPVNVVMLVPTKNIGGGGRVVFPSAWVHYTDNIDISHGVILEGQSKNATVLYQSGVGKDGIRINKSPTDAAQIYTVNNVEIARMTIMGADGTLEGISHRDDTNCYSISECSFRDLSIMGFKVDQHVYGGWNNKWDNVTWGDVERYRSTRIGLIAETCENGGTYGATGDTRSYIDPAGGFNTNVFVNCITNNINRIGVFIRAISAAHAYSNVYIGCNFEAIKYQSGSPLTLPPYTDNITDGPTTIWDGRPLGFLGLGRVIGTSINGGGYFEDISTDGVGAGVLWHDAGIKFGGGASKCYNNTVSDGVLFNANVPRTAHYAACYYCGTDAIVQLNNPDEGFYLESSAVGAYAQDHALNMEAGSPKQIIYDYVNNEGIRVSNTDERIEREGSNLIFERKRATETGVAYYDITERFAVGGGKRKFSKSIATNGNPDTECEYVEVSATSSARQGLKGFPVNGGKFTIPAGTSGSIVINHENADGDNDMPTFCTVLTSGSGISGLWTSRNAGGLFTLHFTGTTGPATEVSYMYFGL